MERGTEDNLGRLYESKILYATNGPGKVSVWTNHGGSDTGKPVRKWKVCVARIWKTRIALYDKFNCAEGVTDILGKEANEAQKTFFLESEFFEFGWYARKRNWGRTAEFTVWHWAGSQ